MSGKSKGNSFEREICTLLSEWWTNGERDDVFWRSATSGGRATQRHKVGKKTYGQQGDIQAVDPIGSKLCQLCTIEAKRGYSHETFADLLDKPTTIGSQWREFIRQSRRECRQAGTPFWLLIAKRDRREVCVYMPLAMHNRIRAMTVDRMGVSAVSRACPSTMFTFPLGKSEVEVVGMLLSDFFLRTKPMIIRLIANEYKKARTS